MTFSQVSRHRWAVAASLSVLLLLAVTGSAFADRTRPKPIEEPPGLSALEEAQRRDQAGGTLEARPTGAAEAAILAASEAERRNVEDNTLAARVERSQKGELALDVPSQLADVADGAKGVMSAISPNLTMVSTHSDDIVSFEEIMYSDGVGYVMVATQLWPSEIDPSGMVEPGAAVETIGQLDYITYDEKLPGADTTSVKIYDGQRMVKVEVVNIATTAEKVRAVALAMYEGYGAAP